MEVGVVSWVSALSRQNQAANNSNGFENSDRMAA